MIAKKDDGKAKYSKTSLEEMKYGKDFKHFVRGRADLNKHMIKWI